MQNKLFEKHKNALKTSKLILDKFLFKFSYYKLFLIFMGFKLLINRKLDGIYSRKCVSKKSITHLKGIVVLFLLISFNLLHVLQSLFEN